MPFMGEFITAEAAVFSTEGWLKIAGFVKFGVFA